MSIPSGDKALGQDGHVGDHNDITDALRDHEERLSAVEGTEASDVPDTRSISTTAPLLGGGDLSADRTLSLALGTGLVESGGSLSPDFGTGSGKVAEGDDSRFTDARTPTAHASTHTDGGSDEIAVTLSQISQSGATTGQVPKWDGSAWSPGDEAGGGGGGGLADASRLWTPGSGVNATYSDEFDDASLDGAWTRVDASGGTGRATWTEVAGCLSLLQNGMSGSDASAELHGLVRPYALAVGEYIETRLSWAGKDANYPMAGLVISSGATHGAGTQVFGGMYRATAAAVSQIAGWTNWTTRGSYTDDNGPGNSQSAHLRLKRTATNDYALYTSPDGVSWALLNTRTGVSFTPAYVGLVCSLYGATTQFAWSFAYFRVGS